MYKLRLRGELCMGFGSVLSLASFILLIFVHVGTTNLTSTPRSIAFAKLNVSDYGNALAIGFNPDPITGLYTTNASAPLSQAKGIRQTYQWGLYGYCAFVNATAGTCSSMTGGFRFTPYDTLVADMSSNYTVFTGSLINATVPFRNSASLGTHTHTAYYLIIVATVLCFVSLLLGLIKKTSAFLFSAALASISAILLLAGAALWSTAIHNAKTVNTLVLAGTNTSLGIVLQQGEGMTLLWAAFGCLVAALIPYWISSCTFRG